MSQEQEEARNTSKVVLLASPTNMIASSSSSSSNKKMRRNLEIFSFEHPKYKQMLKFGLLSVWEEGEDEDNNNSRTILLEVERIGGRYGSWFVGDNIISDGRPYVFSPMDVTFLLIGVLEGKVDKSDESHFDNMNDIIPSIILRVSNVRDMITNVCDVMEVGDDLFVRLSDEKVLAWMIAKSDSIVQQISNNDKLRNSINPQGFKRSLKTRDASDDKKILVESIRFLSEYLDRKWIEKLATHFEVIEEIYPSKGAMSSTSFAKAPKKPTSTAAVDFLDDLEAVEKKRKRKEEEEKNKKSKVADSSRNVSSLKKVNTKGMKSLDSFFKKK